MKARYQRPVAFTGAGISAASGLPTFDTEWRGRPVRDFLSREFFLRDPATFYAFFWETIAHWLHAQPNKAHRVLAEAGMPIVTQNIDGLHQKAGSCQVYEIHGHLRTLTCMDCGGSHRLLDMVRYETPLCEACGGILSPDVVLFGDALRQWDEALQVILHADLVLVVGSSLKVAPACLLPEMARKNGADVRFFNERAEEVLPLWMEENLG